MKQSHEDELPRRWLWLFRAFRRYSVRYVRKHFHALRLAKSSSPFPPSSEPVLIVMNHPAWWDPLIAFIMSRECADREHFGAIDAAAFKQYRFFKWIGFVGVDATSLRGAAEFLKTGEAILSHPGCAFWITAQGRFSDVRERPLNLKSGVGYLATRMERGVVIPLAVEYCFWDERTPEVLVRVGEPIPVADHAGISGKNWTRLIEGALTRTLDQLNADAMSRDPSRFRTLVSGRTGVGGMYDRWRRIKSWVRGERFDPSHEAAIKKEWS